MAVPVAAHASLAEVHMFFGAPSLNAPPPALPDLGPWNSANQDIHVQPGTKVYLPVIIRPLAGDNTSGISEVRSARWRLYGVAGGGGTNANFTSAVADSQYFSFGGSYTPGVAAGDGSTNANGPAGNYQMLGTTGLTIVLGQTYMRSDGTGLPYTYPTEKAYYVGYSAITVAPGAPIGATLDLSFATLATSNGFVFQSGGLPTGGFGWDPGTNLPNVKRFVDPNLDVLTTLANQFSTLGDARITVVPEPASMALLGLGVLALRRRRS
jgi:hypothetical protein